MTEEAKSGTVRKNTTAKRFESEVDGELAVSNYTVRGNVIYFTHTEVPPSMEGQGIGKTLARAALDYARENHLRVVPRCQFISAFIDSHQEYQDLVDADTG
ncbi:MAG: GNAT family N-acetyltransferase [Gemmatimonadaceae bacterium]